jgi:eukaryotic-like serine/threonine-protein kinase
MFRSGQIIGQYILIKQLGQGAFGDVWLAEKQTSPSIQVAIKLPRGEQIDWKSITQEIGLWIICGQHPNVLPFIEAKIFEGQIAIFSEYATGGSLEDLIKESGSLSIDEAIEITIGILNGLAHLHSNGIIHRDLKPANILLQNKTPRLADFGISRVMSTNHSSQTVSGTPYYMAPEAFDGKRNALTDIWAVGVILYQLLTGNLPYPYHEYTRLIGAIVLRQPDPLPTSIPQKLNEIVLKSLAKAPEERFQTAQDMRLQLEAFRKYFYQQSMLATIGNFEEKENAEGRKPKQTLLIPYRRGAKWGYCDLQKNLLIPAHYDRTEFFYEGLAEIGLSGKWGFIDPDGQKVITPKYQSVRRFSKGLAAIKVAAESEDLISKSLWGFINQKEEQVIPPEYDYVESFRGRRAVVSVKHLWGFINRPTKSRCCLRDPG